MKNKIHLASGEISGHRKRRGEPQGRGGGGKKKELLRQNEDSEMRGKATRRLKKGPTDGEGRGGTRSDLRKKKEKKSAYKRSQLGCGEPK